MEIHTFFLFLLVILLTARVFAEIASRFQAPPVIKESWQTRCMIGTAMIPRGGVGLVFAELGRASGVFTNEIYAGLIIVIALTTLLPPFFMKWFYGHYGDVLPSGPESVEARGRIY